MVFQHRAGPVCAQKPAQIVDPGPDLLPLIGVGNLHAAVQALENRGGVGHIEVLPHGPLFSGKGLVGNDLEAIGVEGQRISSDAAGGLISLAEAAVNDDQPASSLDGAFPLPGLDGDMAVNDVAVPALQAELLQDALTDGGVIVQGVVGVFWLRPR